MVVAIRLVGSVGVAPDVAAQAKEHKWAVVLHGGAGVIERKSMSKETDAAYRAALKTAIQAAADVLEKGGSSMDAVEAAIKIMEDDPMFNAGKGAQVGGGASWRGRSHRAQVHEQGDRCRVQGSFEDGDSSSS